MSEAGNLAVHATAVMTWPQQRGRLIKVGELSELLGVSRSHLAKVLQRLSREGILDSRRGPQGGYCLAVEPGSLTLLEIVGAFGGETGSHECLLGRAVCSQGGCVFSEMMEQIGRLTRGCLGGMSLEEFVMRQGPFERGPERRG